MLLYLQDISLLTPNFLQIKDMKPKTSPNKNKQKYLFRPELMKIINPSHQLVKLSKVVDWDHMDEVFGKIFALIMDVQL